MSLHSDLARRLRQSFVFSANEPAFSRRRQGSSALDPESGCAYWEEGGPDIASAESTSRK